MHGYSEFKEDIISIFQEQIVKHQLIVKFEYENSNKIYFVRLYNPDFALDFSLDRMDLLVEIINPRNQDSFTFNDVIHCLYPSRDLVIKGNTSPKNTRKFIKSQLNSCSELLDQYMQGVVFGDFSWSSVLKNTEEQKKTMLAKIMSLDYNHPLYKETIGGNKDWFEKARRYFGDIK
ncbi:hypothetical protein [Algibacter sp. 2305UL17-15]|uniref:hypothetical protein n=1 Tax=Algibacter sp. 2305UL17-15 TaxID=3231268 RepID=UPI003457A869